jgi:hypothetical protein
MNQFLTVKLSIEKNGHEFTFTMPVGSTIGSAYDAAFEFLRHTEEMARNAIKETQNTLNTQPSE